MALRSDLLFKILMISVVPTVLGFVQTKKNIESMEKIGDKSYAIKYSSYTNVYTIAGTLFSYFLFLLVAMLTLFTKMFTDRTRGSIILDYRGVFFQWTAKILITLLVMTPIILTIVIVINIAKAKYSIKTNPITNEQFLQIDFNKPADYYYIKSTFPLIPIIYGCVVLITVFSSPGCSA